MPQVAIDSIELSNKVDIGLYTDISIYAQCTPRYYTLVSYPIGNTISVHFSGANVYQTYILFSVQVSMQTCLDLRA